MATEASKAVRRTHKKSRGGCQTCKARRVKCDETRPICQTCARRQTECLWTTADKTKTRLDDQEEEFSTSPTPSPPSPPQKITSVAKRFSFPRTFDMDSLGIIHHFTTSTALTFFDQPAHSMALQSYLPQFAMSEDFLMHGIFAVTNLHLHCLQVSDPSIQKKNYYDQAEEHFQLAVSGFTDTVAQRSIPQLSNLNLLGNVFLALYTYAKPATPGRDLSPTDTIDWMIRARNFCKGFIIPWSAARNGHLQSPVVPRDMPRSPEMDAVSLAFPSLLSNIHLCSSGTPDQEEIRDPAVSQIYCEAVLGLMAAWTLVYAPNSSYGRQMTLGWFGVLSDEFCEFIAQRRPRALVLLAHYFAMIARFKDTWWIRDRGENGIRSVLANIDPQWTPWLDIPIATLNSEGTWPLVEPETSMFSHVTSDGPPRPYLEQTIYSHLSQVSPNGWDSSNPVPLGYWSSYGSHA